MILLVNYLWYTEIANQFESNGKEIKAEYVDRILEWTEVHTYYTQFFCNQLFIHSKDKVAQEDLDSIQWQILQTAKHDYFQLRELLSPGQKQLIYAIAKEVDFFNPSSNEFKRKYKLSTSRGVVKNLDVLVNKQLINKFYTESGEAYYKLSNVFIMRYINGYL